MKQDYPGKLAKHDEQFNKINYDIIDIHSSLASANSQVADEVGQIKKSIKDIQDGIKNNIETTLMEHTASIDKLFTNHTFNKDNIERISYDLHILKDTVER
jgi:hypothetical protein